MNMSTNEPNVKFNVSFTHFNEIRIMGEENSIPQEQLQSERPKAIEYDVPKTTRPANFNTILVDSAYCPITGVSVS